jgi:4-hydroxy-2-oxoglutarate aldolase
MLTPFTDSGDVDYDAHARNLGRWKKDDLGGYLVLGSNSETAYLTEKEKLRLIELTVEHAAQGRTVLAGTGLESTRETIRLTNLAASAGAHAALVLTPSFYGGQMGDEAQVRHFRAVADGSKIPVLIYNVPAYTHLVISADAVRTLAAHPNIIGMKDSSGDVPRMAALKATLPGAFQFIVGTAGALYPALSLGVTAAVLAPANFAGSTLAKVQALHDAGKLAEARALYYALLPVNAAVTAQFGVPGLKCAAALAGYEAGATRSPLLPVTDAVRDQIARIMRTAGLLP